MLRLEVNKSYVKGLGIFTLGVRDSYVWELVFLRLGVSNCYVWGLVFLRFLTFFSLRQVILCRVVKSRALKLAFSSPFSSFKVSTIVFLP